MTTDSGLHEPAANAFAAADASQTDHVELPAGEPRARDEAAMPEGQPPDTVILTPAFAPPPMRNPDDAWAMLVTAVDIDDDPALDRWDHATLFTGTWVARQPPADGHYDGDLVVRLISQDDPEYQERCGHSTDIEMLLAHQGRWRTVGCWRHADRHWPDMVAPTAAALMGLHNDATSAAGDR
ncbi:hypothetical protein [Amycolatopsis sp. NPDC004079]|uniref:hypothetical protein n=1 Tax=Amycolatopsis sp. NPDC004079 TaxID=3154549 RepID=UPI0033B312FF